MIPFLSDDRGLIKGIILVLIALFILAYFGLNLRSIVNSPTFQDNWALIRDFAVNFWENYLKGPAVYLWNLFVDLIWDPAINNLQKIKNGQPDDIRAAAPKLPVPAGAKGTVGP